MSARYFRDTSNACMKEKAGETFFEGAKYTEKVFKQFSQDAYHGFSPVVDKFAAKF